MDNKDLIPHRASNMTQKYTISWEKMKSPFKKKRKKSSNDFETEWDKIEKEKDGNFDEEEGGNSLVAITPVGPIPIDPDIVNKTFNFWIGHTNFNISNDVVHLIKNIPGVESLDIFTRYRMRISIGKLFNPHNVMSAIGQSVLGHIQKSK